MSRDRTRVTGISKTIAVITCLIVLSGCLETVSEVIGTPELAHVAKGQYGRAVDILEPLASHPKGLPSERLHYLCTAYAKVKRYDRVFPCLDKLRQQINAGDNVPRNPISGIRDESRRLDAEEPITRAEVELELGRYEEAIKTSLRALQTTAQIKEIERRRLSGRFDVFGLEKGGIVAKNSYIIRALAVKGLAEALSDRAEEAQATLRQMETTELYFADPVTPELRDAGIARVLMALGRFSDALAVASKTKEARVWKAIAIAAVLNPDISLFSEIPLLFMQAKARLETGDHASAKVAYDNLRGLSQLRQSGGLYWQLLHDRGRIALIEENTEEALNFLREAVEVIESQRATIGTEASKIGFVGDKQRVYRDLIATLIEGGLVDEAFGYVERAKARALVDLLAEKRTFSSSKAEANQLTALLAQLSKAEREASVLDERASITSIKRVRGISVEITRKIEAAAPELASLVSVEKTDARQIIDLLSPNETLLEYYGEGQMLFAFIVSKSGVRAVRLDNEGLHEEISVFRQALAKPTSALHREIGASLHRRLVEPVTAFVQNPQLTLVPHGPLHYLPFAALPSGNGYLIDNYSIRILPSASVMRFIKPRQGQQADLLALGNPSLGDAQFDLPGAEVEAKALATGRQDSVLLLRERATETAVKASGRAFRRLHLASHGTFTPENTLDSALLLSADAKNDGRLTVAELYDLNLNADLVTLSACETGLGKVASGDDVVGFARGFLYAGASSIVASLWKVDDTATARLMQGFYNEMERISDKREALRRAQIELRDTYKSHPFFWAAFQLTGSAQ